MLNHMKKNIFYILIIITLVGFFSPIFKLQAQTPPVDPMGNCNLGGNVTQSTKSGCSGTWSGPYVLLAPLPCQTGDTGCVGGKLTTFDPTGENKIGGYLNLMIRIFIGLCAVLAVVMIVMGGIEYMTSELISSKEAGKERITGAIFGLLLALGAWTLLYQINPDILNTDLKSLTSQQVVALEPQGDIPQTPTMVNGKAMYGGYAAGSSLTTDFPQNTLATLPSGVTVCGTQTGCGANAQCTTVGQQGCTSTLGLDPSIINLMASDCAKVTGATCPITITAGTEFWLHGGTTGNTSHQPGSSSVDIQATPAMNSYISGNSSVFPKDGTVYTESGVCYYAESAGATSSTTGSHWHVYKC